MTDRGANGARRGAYRNLSRATGLAHHLLEALSDARSELVPTFDTGAVERARYPLSTDVFETSLEGTRVGFAGALQRAQRNACDFGVRLEEGMGVVFVEGRPVFDGRCRCGGQDRGSCPLSFESTAVDVVDSLPGTRVVIAEMADLGLAETGESIVIVGAEGSLSVSNEM